MTAAYNVRVMSYMCPVHVGRRSLASCKYMGCQLVLRHDGPRRTGECFYCGETEPLTIDHVIPKYLGRKWRAAWNCVLACEWCNHKKDNMMLSTWLGSLEGPSYTHPKHRKILERREQIVATLLERPQLAGHRSWITQADWVNR